MALSNSTLTLNFMLNNCCFRNWKNGASLVKKMKRLQLKRKT